MGLFYVMDGDILAISASQIIGIGREFSAN
jgi:hypothetical protein